MSNFKSILKTHKQAHDEASEETLAPSPAMAETAPVHPETTTPAVPKKPSATLKKRGRPSGKRSDDAFVQAPAWIRRDTHTQVKIKLLKEGKGQEFSELVEALLSKWLKTST